MRFGEDAVTSMLAVAINRFGPDGVVVADVRGNEPIDGADVEIWFGHDDARTCGFSAQAKMVEAGPLCGGSYKHLDHPPGSTDKQIDRLIASSARIGKTPVYPLFSHCSALLVKGIGVRPCSRGARHNQFGYALIDAGRVVGDEVGDLLGAVSRSEALRRPGTTEIDDRPRFLVVVPYVMTSDPLG